MKYRILLVVLLALAGCGSAGPTNKGVYLLLDTSGTYSGELKKAEHIILYMLSRLEPADSFAVARIDTGSFSEGDIIAKATFDDRPSAANRQKRVFAGTSRPSWSSPTPRRTPTSPGACCRRSSSSTRRARAARRS